MKKFEYQVISLRNMIQKVRESFEPRKSEGDEVIMLEILNNLGSKGWRLMNPANSLEVYLEREIERD